MVASLYMAEAELLAELELVVRLVVVLVQVLQEVQSQGQWGWMRKIGVDHNTQMNYERWGWNTACASTPCLGPSHPSVCSSLTYRRAVRGYGDGISNSRISLY